MNCEKKQCDGKMRVLETRTLNTENLTRLEIMTAPVPYSIVTEGNAIYRRRCCKKCGHTNWSVEKLICEVN